ncbi:hypothetical protein L6259_00345 [Candidatus Parcubacteria bacterium]|nr:hypothetical protein [Patescibacteria group bacterium]MCG2693727.1 hypothetical protein [Candidatus Parcubacteria bacterium]
MKVSVKRFKMAKIKQKKRLDFLVGAKQFLALLGASGAAAATMGDAWNRESLHVASFLRINIAYFRFFVNPEVKL